MKDHQENDLLHGVTLEEIVIYLVDVYGWEKLGQWIKIRSFNLDPTINSSLKLLRKTPWARAKVEALYISTRKSKLQRGKS